MKKTAILGAGLLGISLLCCLFLTSKDNLYDEDGYDKKGYNKWGFNRNGIDRAGYSYDEIKDLLESITVSMDKASHRFYKNDFDESMFNCRKNVLEKIYGFYVKHFWGDMECKDLYEMIELCHTKYLISDDRCNKLHNARKILNSEIHTGNETTINQKYFALKTCEEEVELFKDLVNKFKI